MSRFTLHHGDSREVLKTLAEASVDSIVTDPPYGIRFMGQAWDGADIEAEAAKRRAAESHCPQATQRGAHKSIAAEAGKYDRALGASHAFQTWTEEWAREALRVLKPGGYLLCFAGTRTYHRMVSGVEDAGFEIRDQIGWAFGSGFPKSHNGEWGGTALKPAWEPIVLARKPLIGTVEENWREHGTGALNIDACRIAPQGEGDYAYAPGAEYEGRERQSGFKLSAGRLSEIGRWPANLIHDGSPDVLACFPSEAGAAAPVHTRNGDKFRNAYGAFAGNVDEQGSTFHGDTGSAARFFYCSKASAEDRHEGVPTTWAKEDLSRAAEALRQLQRATSAVTTQPPDAFAWTTTWYGSDTTARYLSAIRSTIETTTRLTTASKTSNSLPPSNTSACTLAAIAAATANGSSLADLVEFTSRWKQSSTSDQMVLALDAVHAALQTLFEQSRKGARGNGHPTVKPTDLMRWLIRLVTPADGLVLDPFMGSGSTGKAAMLEGMRFVGIDLTADYVQIARARIDFALRQGHQPSLMEA